MAKLNSFDKELFNIYRKEMIEADMHWAFCRETGITIIYKVMPRGNFIKLSVAYCNENDTFKKKLGFIIATERWQNDMSIQIPVVGRDAEHTIELFAELITRGYALLEWVVE